MMVANKTEEHNHPLINKNIIVDELKQHLNSMFNFGVLTASAIFIALMADFFLVPAIMKLLIHNKGDI